MKTKDSPTGIMPFAKTSGLTSFSSLWSIKHALGTDKVGHTGTLDSFADGLLVVLTGSLTHLVPHITGFTKTYEAVVCFGKETDTLDPLGEVIKTGKKVTKEQIEASLESFRGAILQKPPLYSALHVDGKRASDIARSGKEVEMESRQIFIYSLEMTDYQESNDVCYALLKVVCSKGTYIRSLARDIAASLGTAGHLTALRRTAVGPFKLEDAACYSELNPFTIEEGIKKAEILAAKEREGKKEKTVDSPEKIAEIKSRFLFFTPQVANLCGFECDELKKDFEKSYLNGRPLNLKMFDVLPHEHIDPAVFNEKEIAVFYKNGQFAGIIQKTSTRLIYGFVVPMNKKHIFVYNWQDILSGAFPLQWKNEGTSLSVGCFDSLHIGHRELLNKISIQNFPCGIVTFSNTIKPGKDVYSLDQRLEMLKNSGIDFVIAVEFDEEFARLSGKEFFDILKEKCGLSYLAEGIDFTCGYKRTFRTEDIRAYSSENGVEFCIVDDVMCENKKVSTTRIKEEILKGNFMLVQKMLLRPYEVKIAGCKWKEKKADSTGSLFEAELNTTQMLPSNGIYKVAARTEDGTLFHTECEILNNLLRMSLPTKNIASKTNWMVFC